MYVCMYGCIFQDHDDDENQHSCCICGKIFRDWRNIIVPQRVTGSLPYGQDSDGDSFKTETKNESASEIAWAFSSDPTDFVYPELREDLPVGQWLRSRKNLGISMSGGGMRAATCALGWLSSPVGQGHAVKKG